MKISHFLLAPILLIFMQCCSVDKEDEIKVIAHRGGAKLGPENTLAAFERALTLGVDMIEIDVILSKDGEVIVIHDDTIDRTTNGSGVVKEMTVEEIKEYDAGSWFDKKLAGEKIPTLSEVFEKINANTILLIEIKDGDEKYPGLERKVVDLIDQYNAKDWVIVQSFNEKSVLRIRKIDNEIVTYYLLGRNFESFFSKEVERFNLEIDYNKNYDGLALHHSVVNSENVEVINKMGYGLFVWTVNENQNMERLINLKLNGIITDSPDILKEMLNR